MNHILITINIYSDKYIEKQISSINEYCRFERITIIFNCSKKYNDKNLVKYNTNKLNIIINPKRINKKRHTGLITKGIIENFKYISENKYDVVLILSERTIFNNYLNLANCNSLLNKTYEYNNKYNHITNKNRSYDQLKHQLKKWKWKKVRGVYTKLSITFPFYGGLHEGILIDYNTFKKINNFVNKNLSKIEEIYKEEWAVEECIFYSLSYSLDGKIINLLNPGNSIIYNSCVDPLYNHYKCLIKIL